MAPYTKISVKKNSPTGFRFSTGDLFRWTIYLAVSLTLSVTSMGSRPAGRISQFINALPIPQNRETFSLLMNLTFVSMLVLPFLFILNTTAKWNRIQLLYSNYAFLVHLLFNIFLLFTVPRTIAQSDSIFEGFILSTWIYLIAVSIETIVRSKENVGLIPVILMFLYSLFFTFFAIGATIAASV